ncbi:MAG: hypothetical protein K2K97_08775 [Muribaculaceae bacterium]|nr:hypothetical protein [Muribaculaceae bacterium]
MNNWINNALVSVEVLLCKRLAFLIISMLSFYSMFALDNGNTPATNSSDSIGISQKNECEISRNLFVELGGPSFGVGIGYDQRFKPNSVFGFRTGLSFTSGSWDDGGWWGAYDGGEYTDAQFKGITLPLEANAIMGKRASKFELGIGATPCILHRHEIRYRAWNSEYPGNRVKDGVRLNIFGTLNIGYRLQRKSGFFLRAGFTFLIGDLKCSPMDGLLLIPNLSLGYTIR